MAVATDDILPIDDVQGHLNIVGNDDDEVITAAIEAARRHVESWVGPLDEFEEDGVPADIIAAMKLLVGALYDNREATASGQAVTEVPFGLTELIAPYRRWAF